jgi:RNA polymerase sigma factor (sigma-70 family)
MNFFREDTKPAGSAGKYSCDELYSKYGDMLFRVCFSILLNQFDAEDALQGVFYKYIVKSPYLNDLEHAKAWLLHVATNHCRDVLRRRKVRAYIGLEEIAELPDEDTLERFGIDEESGEVLKKLFALPEKYKTVMLLHYLENQSIKTIAESLRLSESAVKMRLSRGREMLRKNL